MSTVSRPLTPAGQRVLDVASELFYERGIGAVGMELIAAEAGVTKKTVYDRFGSKEALVLAYLRARDERWRAFLTSSIENAGGARERILATFDALGDWLRTESARGCAMVNALAELPDHTHPGHRAATDQKEWLRTLYADLAREAGLNESLADQLLILHEGAVVTFSVAGRQNAAALAREAASALLSHPAA
ncbi:TetR/AcrR family transcriptional regulator [Actinomadura rudentiformis]|uniref:TetR/AcrR family transcriptional regulator n=1 Tax=Actinomadura rudentiformis TaxID=359158 RepID=A0A6H9YX86_9ACTN|nr:TetR/AcrR family transcriptional regulator [Actinomadura rudentiformis]KAB2345651.1 TetR/AcrR family transcriptional regulator [Actinomadura rudentiformis]